MRKILLMLTVAAIASLACTTKGSLIDRPGPAGAAPVSSETPANPTTAADDYWIVSTHTLIGTSYFSDVLALPTDDKESVAAAVNAWGRSRGQMTSVPAVYAFSNRSDAQKFKSEKGGLQLEITVGDLTPRLCMAGAKGVATDYWVIAATKGTERTSYISDPLFLIRHSANAITRAMTDWSIGRDLTVNPDATRRFTTVGNAEAFRLKTGMGHLDLTAETLDKYLCANQPEEEQALKSGRKDPN